MPRISVLMSVYNNAPYLRAAIDSILRQTVDNFELIILDDASTDQIDAVLSSYTDPRIIHIRNEKNLGLTHSLNKLLDRATGEYLARMDGDDMSHPTRFETQLKVLEQRPEVGVVAGNITSIDGEGNPLYEGHPEYRRGAEDGFLRWFLYWSNPLPHMTVMMRHDLIREHHLRYDPDLNGVEDFDLWWQLSAHTRLLRLEAPLVQRRILKTSVTRSRRNEQLQLHYQVTQRELLHLLGRTVESSLIGTIVNLIGNEITRPIYYPAATRLLLEVYHNYAARYALTSQEDQHIQEEMIRWLMRYSTLAQGRGLKNSLTPLWGMFRLAPRRFLSRDVAYLGRQAIKREVLP